MTNERQFSIFNSKMVFLYRDKVVFPLDNLAKTDNDAITLFYYCIDGDMFNFQESNWRLACNVQNLPKWYSSDLLLEAEKTIHIHARHWRKTCFFNKQQGIQYISSDRGAIVYIKDSRASLTGKHTEAVICGKSIVKLNDCKTAHIFNSSKVKVYGATCIYTYDTSKAECYDNTQAYSQHDSKIIAKGHSTVEVSGHSSVIALNRSMVNAYEHSMVRAYACSSVALYDSSTVFSYDNNGGVMAKGNSTVHIFGKNGVDITGYDEATILYHPDTMACLNLHDDSTVNSYDTYLAVGI